MTSVDRRVAHGLVPAIGESKPSVRRSLFLTIAVVTLHLQLFSVSTFQVTLGTLLGLCWLVAGLGRLRTGLLITVTATIVGVTATVALFSSDTNAGDYFGTLTLFVVAGGIVVLAISQDRLKNSPATLGLGLIMALAVVTGLSVLQTVTGASGSESFFNIWGDRQYLYRHDPHLEWIDVPRAQGFFLEPSYNAFVILSLTVGLLLVGRFRAAAILLGVIGLVVTQSATGLIISALIALVYGLRSGTRARVAVVILMLVAIPIVGADIVGRLASIEEVGSSASYRITQPIPIVLDVLEDAPLGVPLGSVYLVVSRYGLQMFGNEGVTSLDNGIYVAAVYFGWLGIFAVVALGLMFLQALIFDRSKDGPRRAVLYMLLIGSLFFSGAIMAPDFAFMLGLVVICYRVGKAPNCAISREAQ